MCVQIIIVCGPSCHITYIHKMDFLRNFVDTHAYQLLPPNSSSITLMHYIGNKTAAVDFPKEIKSTTGRMCTHKFALLFYGTSKPSVKKVYRSFFATAFKKKFEQHSTTLIMSFVVWSVLWGVHPVWCRPVHSMK